MLVIRLGNWLTYVEIHDRLKIAAAATAKSL